MKRSSLWYLPGGLFFFSFPISSSARLVPKTTSSILMFSGGRGKKDRESTIILEFGTFGHILVTDDTKFQDFWALYLSFFPFLSYAIAWG